MALPERPRIEASRDRLERIAVDRFGVTLDSVTPVIGGLDDRARVWQAVSTDGAIWCVKATRRDNRFGLALAASLSDAGVPGVLAPLTADTDAPWVEEDGVLVSIAGWIEGDDAITSPRPVSWGDFGATLRRVHEHPVPTVATPTRVGIRRWSLPMDLLLADVDARLAQTADGPDSRHSAHVAGLWDAHRPRLERLAHVERALKRTRAVTSRVPLHGDPHLGNVIVDAARRPWLIDFDEATVAPREVDLMLVELGVIFSAPLTDEQRAEFREGYGPVPLDGSRIVRFGCVRAIEDATATILRLIDAPPAGQDELHQLLAGQFGPHGLVSLTERRLAQAVP